MIEGDELIQQQEIIDEEEKQMSIEWLTCSN